MSDLQSVEIESDALVVTVCDHGAEMQRIRTRDDGAEWLWNGDADWWTGRAPLLFPIVGQAPGDEIALDGRTWPMPKHGFARRSTFRRVSALADRVTHELTDSMDTMASFPRAFRLRVTHLVQGATLTCRAEVTNTGLRAMPFGFGFHPAFRWPLPGAQGRPHHLALQNGGEPALARLQDGLLRPDRLPSPFVQGRLDLDPALFEEDAMIFPEGAGEALTFAAEGGPTLRFTFENAPNLGIWQKPGAPFLCIEPWHGMAATVGAGPEMTDRPGTIALDPGETSAIAYSVAIG